MTGVITEPGVYDLPEDAYHADPVPEGSLSVSGAKALLPPSCPAIYRHEREHGRPDTRAFDFGHAAHRMVLGAGNPITPVDADDWRTKAAKEQRDEIRANGGVPILRGEYEQVQGMAAAIRRHPIAAALLTPERGEPERSAFWTDPETGIWRRARFDFLPHPDDGRMIITDYKTAPTANPDEFQRSVANFGYHQQAAWYCDAAVDLGLTDHAEFVFVVQQKTAPYLVTVVQLDIAAMHIGRALNRRAIDVYTECTAADHWPGYSDDEVALVSVPAWYARTVEETLT